VANPQQTQQPAPIVLDDLWTLAPAQPHRLAAVAEARRQQKAKLAGASNDLIVKTAEICGQSWLGMKARNAGELRKKIAHRVDDLAGQAKVIADILDRVSRKMTTADNALKDSLMPLATAGVGMQTSGGKVTFTPLNDDEVKMIKQAAALAADIRADLDAYLLGAAADLKRANASLCQVSAWASSGEERLLKRNQKDADKLIASGGLNDNVKTFQDALNRATTPDEVRALVKEHGEKLWKEATERAREDFERYETAKQNGLPYPLRPGDGAKTDDRPLYWARLEMESAVRDWARDKGQDATLRDEMISSFDRASRGMTTSGFPPGVKGIFISGFDLFGTGSDIKLGHNPSGAAAMALDGYEFTANGERYQIQAVMMPVRHQEFRDGTVQEVIDVLKGPNPPVAFFSFSLDKGANEIELEETYGRTFGAHADNNNVINTDPMPGVTNAESLSTNMPAAKLIGAMSAAGIPFKYDTAPMVGGVGPADDYFSNALPRMIAETRDQLPSTVNVLTGHYHLPDYAAPSNGITSPAFEASRLNNIYNVKTLIQATFQ
jgi:hypothetical protein